jgi:2-oxo-4-hydroxy-4-carboxy-5-ureidoimidazoline decarboxylase
MIALHDFNHLPEKEALALTSPLRGDPRLGRCAGARAALPSREELFSTALALTQNWDERR